MIGDTIEDRGIIVNGSVPARQTLHEWVVKIEKQLVELQIIVKQTSKREKLRLLLEGEGGFYERTPL